MAAPARECEGGRDGSRLGRLDRLVRPTGADREANGEVEDRAEADQQHPADGREHEEELDPAAVLLVEKLLDALAVLRLVEQLSARVDEAEHVEQEVGRCCGTTSCLDCCLDADVEDQRQHDGDERGHNRLTPNLHLCDSLGMCSGRIARTEVL
jgi:hypothetical protein